MNQLTQWGPVAVIIGGYLLGIYFQNRSIGHLDRPIDELRDSMNKRFDGIDKRFDASDKRFDDFRDLLKSEIKRVEGRIARLEHPVIRG